MIDDQKNDIEEEIEGLQEEVSWKQFILNLVSKSLIEGPQQFS